MSAYTDSKPGQIVHLHGAPILPTCSSDSLGTPVEGVFDKFETFMLAVKQLESSVQQERARSKLLQEELRQTQSLYDRLLTERELKNKQLVNDEGVLRNSLANAEARRGIALEQLKKLQEDLSEVQAELERYRGAWSEVLQREREAKLIIQEGQQTRDRAARLEQECRILTEQHQHERASREQFERLSKSYQQELQNALLRIHSAESKFSQLSKEYQVVYQSRRNVEEEVAKIERSMLERHQWALVKEREKLRAEIEKESVLAQERFRETLREQMRSEIEYERGRVREMSSRLKAELEQSRDVESALLARRDQFEGVLKSLDQDARDLEAALYDGLEELALDPECSETIKVRLHGITSELEAKLKRYSQRIQRALN